MTLNRRIFLNITLLVFIHLQGEFAYSRCAQISIVSDIKNADLIVLGKIHEDKSNRIKLEVLDVLKGQEKKNIIYLTYTDTYDSIANNKNAVFILKRAHESLENIDYVIGKCGSGPLLIGSTSYYHENNLVNISIRDLKNIINEIDNKNGSQ